MNAHTFIVWTLLTKVTWEESTKFGWNSDAASIHRTTYNNIIFLRHFRKAPLDHVKFKAIREHAAHTELWIKPIISLL